MWDLTDAVRIGSQLAGPHAYPSFSAEQVADVVVRGGDNLMYMPPGIVRAMANFLHAQDEGSRGRYFAGKCPVHAYADSTSASGRTVAHTIL